MLTDACPECGANAETVQGGILVTAPKDFPFDQTCATCEAKLKNVPTRYASDIKEKRELVFMEVFGQ